VIADPFISPFGFTITPALSAKAIYRCSVLESNTTIWNICLMPVFKLKLNIPKTENGLHMRDSSGAAN